MSINIDIGNYIGHFRYEHERIVGLDYPLHRKLLIVAMLSSLAEGRYPHTARDSAKFIKLIETYSAWTDATSVSVTQLQMIIDERGSHAALGLSKEFVDSLWQRRALWHNRECQRLNQAEISHIGIDPKPEDILLERSTTTEKAIVESVKHSALLYRYRCKLVHEFRMPGHGFEFDQRGTEPYYIAMLDADRDGETEELVYPTQWFLNLPLPILTQLEIYYRQEQINPYDSYKFGSPWQQK
jgi:hypothetical protein